MEAVESLKSLGLIAILLMVFAATAVLLTSRDVRQDWPLSKHVAQVKATFLLFGLLSVVYEAMMGVFIVYWLTPALHLSPLFIVSFLIAAVCQLGTAWTRYLQEDRVGKLHNAFGYGMALFMPIMLVWLLFSDVLSLAAKAIVGVSVVVMCTFIVIFFLLPEAQRQYLLYQLAYIACFCVAIVAATYMAPV